MPNGPAGFVSFSDYLGLNDEDGKLMLERALAKGDGMNPDQIRATSEKHLNSARDAGEDGKDGGVYESTGEATRKGLASYGQFMQSLKDPELRQALLAKAYGANVSQFDSMLMESGSGGRRLAQAGKDFDSLRSEVGERGMVADNRKAESARLTGQYKANEAADIQRRQGEEDAREEERLAKAWLGPGFARMGTTSHGGSDPNPRDERGGEIAGRYAREARWQDAAGKKIDEARKPDVDFNILGYHPNTAYQRGQSWSEYYAANKRKK